MLNLLGCAADEIAAVLTDIGFAPQTAEDGSVHFLRRRRDSPRRLREERAAGRRKGPAFGDDSPFAKLRQLAFGQ